MLYLESNSCLPTGNALRHLKIIPESSGRHPVPMTSNMSPCEQVDLRFWNFALKITPALTRDPEALYNAQQAIYHEVS